MDVSTTAGMERRAGEEVLLQDHIPKSLHSFPIESKRGQRQDTKSKGQRGGREVAHQGHSRKG